MSLHFNEEECRIVWEGEFEDGPVVRELPRVEDVTVRFIVGDRELGRIPWRP